ncbi:glucuronyl hydrolase [candidate division KSB1 bacterium]|nr:glucuronyl hydrolase [candidate division KSB1 bacterium]
MAKNFLLLLILAVFLGCPSPEADLNELVDTTLDFAESQLEEAVQTISDSTRFPNSTDESGDWNVTKSSSWIAGFFPGCLWYMYERTEEDRWKEWAEKWTAGMEPEKDNPGTHDLGFMIFNSFGHGHRLTENPHYKDVILQTANTLATRFDPDVGCIKSWDWMDENDYPVIIDNMMNLELLFWAAKNGGNSEWIDMAIRHALNTIENHVRPDGGTYHVVLYDQDTGEVLERITHQGYADESTWARGQAWGIYGFTMTYRETEDERFLETAQKMADYFIDHLPEDFVPYWDFNAPNIPDEERDTSAGAIAASALLELSELSADQQKKLFYRYTAENILRSLCQKPYLAKGTDSAAVLLHGVGNKPGGKQIDVALIYGDYYLIEALLRYERLPKS